MRRWVDAVHLLWQSMPSLKQYLRSPSTNEKANSAHVVGLFTFCGSPPRPPTTSPGGERTGVTGRFDIRVECEVVLLYYGVTIRIGPPHTGSICTRGAEVNVQFPWEGNEVAHNHRKSF